MNLGQKRDVRKELYQRVLALNANRRAELLTKTRESQHWLATLTPTQLAQLFPDYYKRSLPSPGLTLAASGGVAMAGASPFGTPSADPLSRRSGDPVRNDSIYNRRGGGNSSTSTALPLSPDEQLWRKLETETGISRPQPTATTLATERKVAAETLTVEQKKHMYALAIAEVGNDPAAQQGLMETIYNRFHSENKSSMAKTMLKDYYQPLRSSDPDGQRRYRDALAKLETPEFFEEMNRVHEKVVSGSNLLDFATHNASGDVYSDALIGKYDSMPGTVRKKLGEGWYNKKRDKEWLDEKREALRQEEEAKKKALDDAAEKSRTGEELTPGDGKTDVPRDSVKPEGLEPRLSKLWDKASVEERETIAKQIHKMGGVEGINAFIQKAYPPGASIDSVPNTKSMSPAELKETFKEGDERFFRETGNLEHGKNKLNPKLVEVMKAASKDLPPGYHVKMISGADARPTGTANHPGGVAMDLIIVDDKGNNILHKGFGKGHKIYEQLSQSMNIRGKEMYPGTNYIWGGAWESRAAGIGDRMHYQIVDPEQVVPRASSSSGSYTFEGGATNRQYAYMTHEERRAYQKHVNEKMKEERRIRQEELNKASKKASEVPKLEADDGRTDVPRAPSTSSPTPVPGPGSDGNSSESNTDSPSSEPTQGEIDKLKEDWKKNDSPKGSSPSVVQPTPSPQPSSPQAIPEKQPQAPSPVQKPKEFEVPPIEVPQDKQSSAPTPNKTEPQRIASVKATNEHVPDSPSATKKYADITKISDPKQTSAVA